MPLIFGFMFYQFPSGLVLYYLTSNLVDMGQQWFFNHTEAAQEARPQRGAAQEKERQEITHVTQRKYSVGFGRTAHRRFPAVPCCQAPASSCGTRIQDAEPGEGDFETPDVVVKFTGPDVDLLLANKAEMLLALEHLAMETLRSAFRRPLAHFLRRQRLPAAARSRNCA